MKENTLKFIQLVDGLPRGVEIPWNASDRQGSAIHGILIVEPSKTAIFGTTVKIRNSETQPQYEIKIDYNHPYDGPQSIQVTPIKKRGRNVPFMHVIFKDGEVFLTFQQRYRDHKRYTLTEFKYPYPFLFSLQGTTPNQRKNLALRQKAESKRRYHEVDKLAKILSSIEIN